MSIGVPVCNEDRFLEESLRSLLAQDYGNTEIIVSDNASTDRTGEICREFSARDRRIRYCRLESNEGAGANFRRVLGQARGKYFMWAAGHDLWSPTLISDCVQLLEAEPAAVIAFGSCRWVDASGRPMPKASGWTDTRGRDAVGRFFTVFWGNMHPIYGVIRLEALREARLLSCVGMDLVLLSELALIGDFVHAPTALWSRREFRQAERHQERMNRYRSTEYGLSRSLIDRLFPLARLPLELARAVLRSKISWLEKLAILGILMPSLPVKYVTGRRQRSLPGPESVQSHPR